MLLKLRCDDQHYSMLDTFMTLIASDKIRNPSLKSLDSSDSTNIFKSKMPIKQSIF